MKTPVFITGAASCAQKMTRAQRTTAKAAILTASPAGEDPTRNETLMQFGTLTRRAQYIRHLHGQSKYLAVKDLLRHCKQLLKQGGKRV